MERMVQLVHEVIQAQRVVLVQWAPEVIQAQKVIRVHGVHLVLLVHPVQQPQVILEQLVGHLIIV
jgi:hypothetical protein